MPLSLRIQTSGDPKAEPRIVVVRSFPASIGRGTASSIRLEDESVSTLHAVITHENGSYLVRDAESLNGTLVGGLRVARDAVRELADGDVLRVGCFWLQVHMEATAVAGDFDTRDLALGLVSKVLRHLPNEHALRVVEGARRGEIVVLADGEENVFGRDERSPVRLEGALVSREHVYVTRRGADVFVRDGGSRNGSSLGGSPLPPGTELLWQPVAHLRTGNVVLSLCGQRPDLDGLLGLSAESALPAAPSPPVEGTSQIETPPVVEDVATPDGVERAAETPAPVASISVDREAEPSPEKRELGLVSVIPIVALLIIAACLAGVAWLIMT